VKLTLGDDVGLRNRGEYLFRSDGRISRIRDFSKQENKFIPTEAAYGVRTTHTSNRAFCNHPKQFVANLMPLGIVDLFEPIHIQK
jgi:hypothetical protein